LEQEKDYIKREIQKLSLVLMKLIDKTASSNTNNFEAVVYETNEKLEEFFGLSLKELAIIENSKLMGKVKSFHEEHLEKLIELLYQTIQKSEKFRVDFEFEIKELSNKLLLLIDFANDKGKLFSVERMNMKSQLIKNNNK
jgi:hypothetical protein